MKFKDFKKLHVNKIIDLMSDEDIDLINKIKEETEYDLPLEFYVESYIDVVNLARFKNNEEIFTIKEYLKSYLEDVINLKSIHD